MTSYYLAEPTHQATNLLHDSEMKCLKIIAAFGPLPLNELAATMHVTKPRVTRLATDLVQSQLAQLETADDKRIKLVSATPAGRKLVREVQAKYQELAECIEHKLGVEKTVMLRQLLSDITPLSELTPNHKERKL